MKKILPWLAVVSFIGPLVFTAGAIGGSPELLGLSLNFALSIYILGIVGAVCALYLRRELKEIFIATIALLFNSFMCYLVINYIVDGGTKLF